MNLKKCNIQINYEPRCGLPEIVDDCSNLVISAADGKPILVISLLNLYDEKTVEVKMHSMPDSKVSYVPETGNSGTILIRRD